MALSNKRIIDLPERSTLNDDDFTVIDGDTGGTAKFKISQVSRIDEISVSYDSTNKQIVVTLPETTSGTTTLAQGSLLSGSLNSVETLEKESLADIAEIEPVTGLEEEPEEEAEPEVEAEPVASDIPEEIQEEVQEEPEEAEPVEETITEEKATEETVEETETITGGTEENE